MSAENTPRPGRPMWTLAALALLFFGPMAVSMWMYFSADGWRPEGSTAHGILLAEPLVLDTGAWVTPEGGAVELAGKWQLVHVVDRDCDVACADALVASRQVRRALGRDMTRIQRVLWLDGAHPDPESLAREHSGLLQAAPSADEAARIRAAIGPAISGNLLLIDPLGNLIMHFPEDTGMAGLHDDLKKLLRASQIG